ncbi:MAG: SusC/RagA family TonB-linked outer membrane protein [Bacteroidota bacterium]
MKSKFTWIFTLLLAFFIQFAFAQEKTITGVVSDVSGGLPGVTVMVKGNPASAVTTDLDGKYTITASVGQVLVFQYVSMGNKEYKVTANQNTIDVEMVEEIEAVIVDKYRTQTRATNPNAVTTITSKTIEGRPNASFIQTLQGQVPGLNISTGSGQPGANSTVILRGVGSINGNIEPLYVIDGVPLNSDSFRSINPNDIESVSVLKDAGATSIYGNRGANGVIVVKTKRGSFDAPLNVSYTGITSFQTMQNNKYDRMNSRQLLTLENTMGRGMGGTMTPAEIAAFDIDTNWKNELFRTGVTKNHVLNLTSGGSNLSSFTSFGYFDQEGILESTDLKRFNFRNNITGKSNDGKFNYSTALTLNWSRRNEASNLGTANVNINPVIAANSGVPYLSPGQYTNGRQLHDLYLTNPTLVYTPLMLLDMINSFTNQTDEIKMIGNVQASYQLTDDFTVGTAFGTDYTQAIGLRVQDPGSFNSYLFQNPGEDYLGFQTESLAYEAAFNFNTSLNYNHVFAEKHTIDATAYTEYYKAHSKGFSGVQSGLDPKLFTPGNGDGFIPFNPATPNFYVPSVTSNKATAGLFSYFASLDYDYSQKYGVAATVRRDASYRFNESNRWGTFYSVSARWNIDKENFMQGSDFNMLKLRASYGTAGNQNIQGQSIFSAANLTRTLYNSGTAYGNLPGYFVSQYGNNDLKWEVVTQANLGLDFEVWNSKLRGNLDVYQKTTDDLFMPIPISGINGTYSLDANYGTLRNRGIEALVGYDVIDYNDFKLTLNFNGSYNQNRIIDIAAEGGMVDNTLTVLSEGHRIDEFYLIDYAGVNPANGNLLFYDKDGVLTENPNNNDRKYTGKSSIPSYQGGFGLDASYKGFFLTTSFTYVADIYRFDYDLSGLQDPASVGQFNKSTDLQRAWTVDNRVTDIPSLFLTNSGSADNSNRYLKDASYVRLRYASVGYNFPKNFLQDTPFSSIKAYLQGENLVTWTKWRGWDAESNRANDQNQYPTPRIVSVGLEVQF